MTKTNQFDVKFHFIEVYDYCAIKKDLNYFEILIDKQADPRIYRLLLSKSFHGNSLIIYHLR